eukprot:3935042-Rhodomonas_salina.3
MLPAIRSRPHMRVPRVGSSTPASACSHCHPLPLSCGRGCAPAPQHGCAACAWRYAACPWQMKHGVQSRVAAVSARSLNSILPHPQNDEFSSLKQCFTSVLRGLRTHRGGGGAACVGRGDRVRRLSAPPLPSPPSLPLSL